MAAILDFDALIVECDACKRQALIETIDPAVAWQSAEAVGWAQFAAKDRNCAGQRLIHIIHCCPECIKLPMDYLRAVALGIQRRA